MITRNKTKLVDESLFFVLIAVQETEYRGDILPEDASDDTMEPLRMAPLKSFRMEVIDC